jgi:hypothetical protein
MLMAEEKRRSPADDQREVEELTRQEGAYLQHAVELVAAKASSVSLRAAYVRLEGVRARKKHLLRELGLLEPVTDEVIVLPKPGTRSGVGAAEAWRYLQQDVRLRGRPEDEAS